MPKKAELEQEVDQLKQKRDEQQAAIDELNQKRDEQEAIIAELKRQYAEEIAAARNAQQPEVDAQDLNHQTQLAILHALQQLQRPNPTPESSRRTINVSSLPKLDKDVSLEEFLAWRAAWNDLYEVERVKTYSLREQSSALRMAMTLEMRCKLKNALKIDPEVELEPKAILDQIQQYIRSQRNVTIDRVDFDQCKQKENESFDDFYVRLCTIAEGAQLCGTCRDTRMATRIISGIHDQEVKKKLLALRPFPKEQQVVDICRGEEAAAHNQSALAKPPAVAKVTKKHKGKQPDAKKGQKTHDLCGKCGTSKHADGKSCPATGAVCSACGKKNHFARMCRSNKKEYQKAKEEKSDIGSVRRILFIKPNRPAPKINVAVSSFGNKKESKMILATPDTGADDTVAGLDVLEQLGIKQPVEC